MIREASAGLSLIRPCSAHDSIDERSKGATVSVRDPRCVWGALQERLGKSVQTDEIRNDGCPLVAVTNPRTYSDKRALSGVAGPWRRRPQLSCEGNDAVGEALTSSRLTSCASVVSQGFQGLICKWHGWARSKRSLNGRM